MHAIMRYALNMRALILLTVLMMPVVVLADDAKPGRIGDGHKKYVVAFAQDTMRNDWRVAQVRELREALAPYPAITFKSSDAGGKTANQVLDIERFIEEKVDIIVTSPVDTLALAPVVSKAFRQGIPVVLLSRSVKTQDYTVFVTGNNFDIGKSAASYIADKLGDKGNILMLEGISTSSTSQARTDGFLAGLKPHKGLRITYRKHANYLRGKAIEAIEEALADNIPFDAIYAHSDSMAAGARVALKKAGKHPGAYVIVGIDYISEAREAIRAGEQAASFTYPTYGREGGNFIIRILGGHKIPKNVVVNSTLVTADNVETVEPVF